MCVCVGGVSVCVPFVCPSCVYVCVFLHVCVYVLLTRHREYTSCVTAALSAPNDSGFGAGGGRQIVRWLDGDTPEGPALR